MSLRHTATAVVVITTLLLALAAPAGAATDTTARGSAATTSLPLEITVGDTAARLGEVAMIATTDSETDERAPWSSVGLTLADIAGTTVGELAVASDGDTTNPGQSFAQDTALGSVGATAAKLLAIADDTAGSATAAVTSLETNATVLNDLGLSATVTDVVSSVDATGAAATHTLTVDDIVLDLGAILGADLLGKLPLQDLLAIATELGITPPDNIGDASEVIAATETLVTEVTEVVAASQVVDGAAADLLTAFTNLPADIADAIAAIEALDPASPTIVTDLTNALATFSGDALTCVPTTLPTTIDQAYLDSIIQCLYNEALGDDFTALETALTNYLAAVADAATAAGAIDETTLDDVLDGVLALIDQLADLDFGTISSIEVSQQVRAIGSSLEGSSASHTCSLTTITALGEDPLEIADCEVGDGDTLALVVDTITGTLDTVFETIGGVDAGNGLELSLFGTVEKGVTEGTDGFIRATSDVNVLRLAIPALTVTPCDVNTVGQLVCALGIDLLAPLQDALDDLGTAQDTVETALSDVAAVLTALGETLDATAGTDAETAVTTVIGAVQGVLDGLELGALGTGGGLTLPGATVEVDPQLAAEHQVTAASVGDPTPANPAPDAGDPSLPNTGGGAALLAMLAIGAGAWLWRGRRREG